MCTNHSSFSFNKQCESCSSKAGPFDSLINYESERDPCQHAFCLACINRMAANNNIYCPCCGEDIEEMIDRFHFTYDFDCDYVEHVINKWVEDVEENTSRRINESCCKAQKNKLHDFHRIINNKYKNRRETAPGDLLGRLQERR